MRWRVKGEKVKGASVPKINPKRSKSPYQPLFLRIGTVFFYAENQKQGGKIMPKKRTPINSRGRDP